MSLAYRALDASIKNLKSVPKAGPLAPPRTSSRSRLALRRFAHSSAALQRDGEYSEMPYRGQQDSTASTSGTHDLQGVPPHMSSDKDHRVSEEEEAAAESRGNTSTLYSDHLNSVFRPLQFPQALGQRLMTHSSHPAAGEGHNGRLAFIGRRVLTAYILLFAHSAQVARQRSFATLDYDALVPNSLSTYLLGEHVAPRWNLGRVLRWVPTASSKDLRQYGVRISGRGAQQGALQYGPEGATLLKSVGLYKVQGEAVEAVIGGIYHQFGGAIAHRAFHTRLLPYILLPGTPQGVPDNLHQHALDITAQFGGLDSDLLAKQSYPIESEDVFSPPPLTAATPPESKIKS